MLSFVDYIHESNDILADIHRKEVARKFAETIKKDCARFIEESKNSDKALSRYFMRRIIGMERLVPRTDRKPVDTPQWLHDYLDKMFLEKFGWKARSEGVFAVAIKRPHVGAFDQYNPIFPIGDYKYIWSRKVTDVFLTIQDVARDFDLRWKSLTGFPNTTPGFELTIERLVKTYRDDNLTAYFKSQPPVREIMIKCEAYYAVEKDIGVDVMNEVYG